jgi:hypothetical protein
MSCTKKQFEAVLAKNRIARAIKYSEIKWFNIEKAEWLISDLKEIEKVIGSCNQPTVDEIIKSDEYEI